MMSTVRNVRLSVGMGLWLVLLLSFPIPTCATSRPPTVEELKARVAQASLSDRPGLCIRISELQLDDAGKLYAAGDSEQAAAPLADVLAFSELARDYSIQLHKHEKESEIAIRRMIRKLTDLKHTVGFADQKPIQEAVDRLEKVRDDLLAAMFPKGEKK